MRLLGIVALGLAALLLASSASAKDFHPGDLRLCNAKQCLPVQDRPVLRMLGAFYYGPHAPPPARAPRFGAPAYELRFRNGYATGIVATASLDRFLSYGVNLGHFQARRWYRVPDRISLELRRLASRLAPLRVTRATLEKSF